MRDWLNWNCNCGMMVLTYRFSQAYMHAMREPRWRPTTQVPKTHQHKMPFIVIVPNFHLYYQTTPTVPMKTLSPNHQDIPSPPPLSFIHSSAKTHLPFLLVASQYLSSTFSLSILSARTLISASSCVLGKSTFHMPGGSLALANACR